MFSYKFQGKKFKSLDKFLPLVANTTRRFGRSELDVYHNDERLAYITFYVNENNDIAIYSNPNTDILMLMIRADDKLKEDKQ